MQRKRGWMLMAQTINRSYEITNEQPLALSLRTYKAAKVSMKASRYRYHSVPNKENLAAHK